MSLFKQFTSAASGIEQELLRMLVSQSWLGPAPVFFAMSVIASFAAPHVAPIYWVSWLALVFVILIGRSWILIKLPKMDHIPASKRLNIAVALSGLNGCVHALSLFFFPFFEEYQRAIQTGVLMGIGFISVVTTAGFVPISMAYVLPTMVPVALLWLFIHPAHHHPVWLGYAVSAMILLFASFMVFLAGNPFKLFRESFEIRQQQHLLNQQLQAALDQAESANRAKTRFLASASHDLRQPIHALSLFAGALAKHPLEEKSRDIARHMDIALQALTSQLDALLDISKLDAGIVQVNRQVFNLRLMVERLQDEFKPSAENKKLRIWLDCPEDAFVESDELLLERILRNLLSNAVKYTDSGKVDIDLCRRGKNICLKISDTGRGIPESEQTRVFEEFYQLSNPERDRSKGLGLGLAIVRRLVELLDIEFHMWSAPGCGTKFTLAIEEATSVPKSVLYPYQLALSWSDICALVVDDEAEVGLGMQALLESLGCKVLLADSTLSAMSEVSRIKPDIVLADYRLRGKDNGIFTIQSVRESYPGTPAILISGDTAPDCLRRAEDAGIELLHKPVLVDDLECAIAHACEISVKENVQ